MIHGGAPGHGGFRRGLRGFTLLELLVVLLLTGLAYGLAAPGIGSGNDALQLGSAARQLGAGLRQARSRAITGRQEAVLTLDLAARQFSLTVPEVAPGSPQGAGAPEGAAGEPPPRRRVHRLPKRVDIVLVTASSEQIDDQVAGIRFFPDGGSTGGRITLSVGAARKVIEINWLTGRVSLQEV